MYILLLYKDGTKKKTEWKNVRRNEKERRKKCENLFKFMSCAVISRSIHYHSASVLFGTIWKQFLKIVFDCRICGVVVVVVVVFVAHFIYCDYWYTATSNAMISVAHSPFKNPTMREEKSVVQHAGCCSTVLANWKWIKEYSIEFGSWI